MDAPFWEAAHAHQLVVQQCGNCGVLRHPPRPVCAACGSHEQIWLPVAGRGTVWSFIVLHAPVLPAFAANVPMPVVVVELELDLDRAIRIPPTPMSPIRMVGGLDTRNASEDWAEHLVIGAPVHATFREVNAEVTLVDWELVDDVDPSAGGVQ
jgi:uncharacterized OB-fold protein